MKATGFVNKDKVGIAGEFYALAQLARLGFVASFTLANTKAVDVLVFDDGFGRFSKLEVKTTQKPPRFDRRFAPGPVYSWPMSAKHEGVKDGRLIYCFAALRGLDELPLFFVVPSTYVADYVEKEHRHWNSVRTRPAEPAPESKPNLMRQLRIDVADPLGFRDNWSLLSGQAPPGHQVEVPGDWFARKA
jgi:hypothetical protein